MHLRLFLIGLSLGCLPWLSPSPLAAQTTPLPPASLQDLERIPVTPPPEPPTPRALPPIEQIVPTPTSPASPTIPDTPCQPPTIAVTDFTFTVKPTAFTEAELKQLLLSSLPNKSQVTCGQLTAAVQRITQKYVAAGYINSGAALPADARIINGVVPILISEGQLEPIQVCFVQRLVPGEKPPSRPCERLAKRPRLQKSYISDRVIASAGQLFNQQRLLEALRLLKLNPLIEDIRAQISPSSRTGFSVLTLEVIEAQSLRAEVLLDNGRSPSVGSFRRQIQGSQGNLTGKGDSLSLTYANTNGSNTGTINYTLPLNPRGGTLSFNLGLASSSIIEKPFSVLDIEANSQSYDIIYRQPIVLKPEREFALSLVGSHRVSQATLLNGLVPFPSIGAEADGKTRVTALRFVQEAVWRSPVEIVSLRSEFSSASAFSTPPKMISPPIVGLFLGWGRPSGCAIRSWGCWC